MHTQRILINARRLSMMRSLKMESSSAEDKEGRNNAYQMFQSQCAVTILHEISHTFITFLGEDIDNTPPVSPNKRDEKRSEAGERLEQLVFGGRLTYLQDKRVGENDYCAGSGFMLKKDGQGSMEFFSITKEAIDSILGKEFQFPFQEGCITQLEPGYYSQIRALMQEGTAEKGQTENPALHPDWEDALSKVDPEWKKRMEEVMNKIRVDKIPELA